MLTKKRKKQIDKNRKLENKKSKIGKFKIKISKVHKDIQSFQSPSKISTFLNKLLLYLLLLWVIIDRYKKVIIIVILSIILVYILFIMIGAGIITYKNNFNYFDYIKEPSTWNFIDVFNYLTY